MVQSPIDRALSLLAASHTPAHGETKSTALTPANATSSAVPAKDSVTLPDHLADENDDRREHPRRNSSSRVMMSFGLMDVSDPAWAFRSTPHQGQLLDLSMRGAAFESDHPAEANTVVVLRLTGGDFDAGRMLRARIIRCDALNDGYRIVARFLEDLSLEVLYQYSRHRFSHDVV